MLKHCKTCGATDAKEECGCICTPCLELGGEQELTRGALEQKQLIAALHGRMVRFIRLAKLDAPEAILQGDKDLILTAIIKLDHESLALALQTASEEVPKLLKEALFPNETDPKRH